MHLELHFIEKRKILSGIPKSLVKDKGRHGEVGGEQPQGTGGECPLFQGQIHTHTHTPLCTHSAHSHMHMCVQGSSKGVTLPQGQHDSLKEGSPKWPWFRGSIHGNQAKSLLVQLPSSLEQQAVSLARSGAGGTWSPRLCGHRNSPSPLPIGKPDGNPILYHMQWGKHL